LNRARVATVAAVGAETVAVALNSAACDAVIVAVDGDAGDVDGAGHREMVAHRLTAAAVAAVDWVEGMCYSAKMFYCLIELSQCHPVYLLIQTHPPSDDHMFVQLLYEIHSVY
jgi:hypothetical protein